MLNYGFRRDFGERLHRIQIGAGCIPSRNSCRGIVNARPLQAEIFYENWRYRGPADPERRGATMLLQMGSSPGSSNKCRHYPLTLPKLLKHRFSTLNTLRNHYVLSP